MTELNPCPKCLAIPRLGYACGEFFIIGGAEGCPVCDEITEMHSSEAQMIESWNRRTEMTNRKMLIELISTADFVPITGVVATIGSRFNTSFIEPIADHLISHGVTVQKWIPVTERLPETDDFVLVIATGRAGNVRLVNAVELATYDPTDSHNPWLLESAPAATEFQVSYWMPLPALPKEVDNR